MPGIRERFAALITAQPADLGRAALEIARIAQPDLDPEPSLRTLDALAAGLAPRLPSDPPPDDAARLLAHYLFDECGFRGNRDDYYDPRNSLLNEVLERRAGIPISLSVLAIEVGRRLRIPLEGVGFPGHFLVRVVGPRGVLLLDPFHGGTPVSNDELLGRLRNLADTSRGPATLTRKCPGKPTPSSGMRSRRPTSMASTDSEIGIPARRSSTSFRRLLRGS